MAFQFEIGASVRAENDNRKARVIDRREHQEYETTYLVRLESDSTEEWWNEGGMLAGHG